MAAVQRDIVQGSEEWHAWRKKGPCASDIPALFEVSPYKTYRDCWFEKSGFGQVDDEDRSYIFARGHETEAELRQMFSKHTNIDIKPTCFENGIFRASLDGYDKGLGILEVKLVGKEVLKQISAGMLPEHHRIQVQSQLFCSESDKAFYGARAPKVKDVVVVEIGRDEKLIKQIQRKGELFWDSVLHGIVPPLTGADTLFITDPAHVALFEQLAVLKAQKDSLEIAYNKLDSAVKELSTHPKVKCGDITVCEATRSGSIDYTKIPEVKALTEEYLEEFRKRSSTYKTIRFGKGV